MHKCESLSQKIFMYILHVLWKIFYDIGQIWNQSKNVYESYSITLKVSYFLFMNI